MLLLFSSFKLSAGETYTSPEDAGALFKVQGEYLGVIEAWGGNWGAQVIATSDKTLEVHLLEGGLPGEGFEKREPTRKLTASLDATSEKATAKDDTVTITLKPDTLGVFLLDGKLLGTLTKVIRESSTLGAKCPEGAKVLFAENEVNTFADGKIVEGGLLSVGCSSSELVSDHTLHIEFRTPFQPSDSGQGRGNSGVYVQGRYEVQVLDSFGLRGENNECGGIYTIATPKVNMCYPPLSWQTYDIDFKAAKYTPAGQKMTNARITVRHNGILIHDDVELPKGTPGKDPESEKPGALYLQDHGNPVAFRNIWVNTNANSSSPSKPTPNANATKDRPRPNISASTESKID
jgi:hypothetical protein